MYAYLRGKIIEKSPETGLILDVHGIGYHIVMPAGFLSRLPEVGETYEVPVSYQVREDDATLYGFPSNEEKHLFELLISVTGIGPKMGIQMVDKLPPEQFALAILNGDIPRLTQVKGVGKKTAQRLILELKDKLKEESWVQDAEDIEIETPVEEPDEARQDVAEALTVLGYSAGEVRELMRSYDPVKSVEDNVRDLLRLRAPKI